MFSLVAHAGAGRDRGDPEPARAGLRGAIVLVTRSDMPGEMARAFDAGCDEYVNKSNVRERLVAELLDAIGRRYRCGSAARLTGRIDAEMEGTGAGDVRGVEEQLALAEEQLSRLH